MCPRRGLFREADASNEAPSYSAGEAMTLAGMQRGTLETAKDTGERAEHELAEPPPRVTDAAVHERFNLHASVHVPAHDDLARERLCRYLARPAFSLARLGVRRDGLVVYRVKNAGRGIVAIGNRCSLRRWRPSRTGRRRHQGQTEAPMVNSKRPHHLIMRECDHCAGDGEVFCDDCGDELFSDTVDETDSDVCKTCGAERLEECKAAALEPSADKREPCAQVIPEAQRTTVQVKLRLGVDVAEDLDALAARWGVNRSQAVARMVAAQHKSKET